MTSTLLPRAGRFVPLVGVLALAACDIPSEPPIFQQTWLVPADSVQVGVSTLLPADVSLTGGGTAFTATTPAADFNTTLGALCGQPECQSPAPVLVPNTPAFTSPAGVLGSSIALPSGVAGVTVSGGNLTLQVTNDLGFDPLRPNGAGGPHGTLSITITSGGINATTNFTGTVSQLPTGAMASFVVPLPLGNYTGTIGIDVAFNVPQGGPATVSASNGLSVSASLVNLAISSASVVVAAKSVSSTPESFDLADVDLGDLVEGGGLVLTIVNPFNANASLSLTLSAPAQGGGPAVNVVKAFNMTAGGTSVVDLTLLKSEIEGLLGKTGVTVSISGNATGTGAGNTVTVSPTQAITVRTQMSLTLNVGA